MRLVNDTENVKASDRNEMMACKAKFNWRTRHGTGDELQLNLQGARRYNLHTDADKAVTRHDKMKGNVPEKKNTMKLVAAGKENTKEVNKNKGKKVEKHTARKALSDVSNMQRDLLRKTSCDGSKRKIPTWKYSNAVVLTSENSSQEKLGFDPSSKVGVIPAVRKGAQNVRLSSCIQSSNIKYPTGFVARNNRASLPLLKRASTAGKKPQSSEKNESSRKARQSNVFPVKGKTGKNVAPRLSIGRTNLWTNRVSDGFILMAPKNQGTSRYVAPLKKPIKPVRKATKAVNPETSISECASTMPEISLMANVPTKTTKAANLETSITEHASTIPKVSVIENWPEETEKFASSDTVEVKVIHEILPKELDGNKSSEKKLGAIGRRQAGRRRSYTSILMTRLKGMEGRGQNVKPVELPNIDNDNSHLDVVEYVDEIYNFYWLSEAQSPSLENCLSFQPDITSQMRGILINWLIEVHHRFGLMQETLYLTVTLLDRFLSLMRVKRSEMQLVGLTALLLASKYEDFLPPRIRDLISISADTYTRDDMLAMEALILKKLNFRINAPTTYLFMLRFLKAAQADIKGHETIQKMEHLAFYLIELCLVQSEVLKFRASMICASSVYIARCTLLVVPAWTPLLAKHTRYQLSQIRECAEMILGFQQAARKTKLKVTYEKHLCPDRSAVARMKPLNSLPI